jgi:hypothetical protein
MTQAGGGRIVAIAVGLIALTGCGGDGGSTSKTSTTGSTTVSPVVTYGGIVGKASKDACLLDVRGVQQASDAYAATHDRPAPSIDALVTAGILHAPPETGHGYVIGYDPATGKVTATGAC